MLVKKEPRDTAGLFRKLSASPFPRPGGGAIQPGSILVMSGSLAQRSPERVVQTRINTQGFTST
jgi:hypothetical protein